MAALRSLIFALLFYPGTLLYCIVGLLLAPFGSKYLQRVVHGWADYHHDLVRDVLGIRMVWDGEIPEGPYLIAVKHEAMVETVESLRFARTPVVVMKKSLTTMPFFGWVNSIYGTIGVDRTAGAAALRAMMNEAKAARDSGRPVVIFPEGTRVPHGSKPPLRPGFAGLYKMLGLPVVPVAQDSGKIWPRGFVKRPGTIHYKVGETIPAGLPRDEVEARVHAALNALND